jgi:hypothetical protein
MCVATGTITVTGPLGAQYTYSIDGTNFQSSPTFNNVAPNTYTVTVQDAGGCSSSASYTVNPAPQHHLHRLQQWWMQHVQ